MESRKRDFFRGRGIKYKVILILSVIGILTIGFLVNNLQHINELDETKQVIHQQDVPDALAILKINQKINEATHFLNLYIESKDNKYRDLLQLTWEKDINPFLTVFEREFSDNETKGILLRIKSNISDIQLKQKGIYEQTSDGDFDQFRNITNRDVYPQLEQLNRNIEVLLPKLNEEIRFNESRLGEQILTQKTLTYIAIVGDLILLLVMGFVLTRYYNHHIENIRNPLHTINQGEIPENLNGLTDESEELIQEINSLSAQLSNVRDIAIQVGKGEFDTEITVFDNKGEVGTALEGMRKSLRNVAVQDDQRNWLNAGYAKFGDILRENNNDIAVLCEQVIINLVKYLDANQGALFLLEGEGEEAHLELKSSYAYERLKKSEMNVLKGEGLVGQAWQEDDSIYITDIPDTYINIRSGLGGANPKSVLVVPLRANEEVVGAVEVASFVDIEDFQKEFVEKVSENIAAAVSNTIRNQQTSKLLADSQQMTEEMRAQEEEMRQNMEEMEATQEEMGRAQREMSVKESNMNALINNTEDTIFSLDKEYRITVVNDTLKNKYKGLGVNLEVGAFIYDALNDEQWKVWKERYDRALNGERYTKIEESSASGGTKFVETYHNPIYDAEHKVIGVSVISRDITEIMMAQQAIKEKESTLNAIINTSDDTFFALDLDYKITVVNETLKKRFADSGISLNEGDYIFDKLPEDTHAVWKDRYGRALAGESFTEDQERKLKDRTLYIRGYYDPIKDQDGNIIGASVRSSDISDMKEIMDELEAAQKELAKHKK